MTSVYSEVCSADRAGSRSMPGRRAVITLSVIMDS